jgi:hypothetical protein
VVRNLTKRERRYVDLQQFGCLACRTLGFVQPPDMHHQLSGGRRIGDHATVPLCPWHHRSVWIDRFTNQAMARTLLGPSLASEPKEFRERFGTDAELLAKVRQLYTGRIIAPED